MAHDSPRGRWPQRLGHPKWLCLLLVGWTACGGGGGGGGSGSFDRSAVLVGVRFPDPNNVNPEPPRQAPRDAPLNQQVVLEFSGSPDPDQVHRLTLPVLDRQGFPVAGRYQVIGHTVRFTPALPSGTIPSGARSSALAAGAGLQPGKTYSIVVSPRWWSFVESVDPGLQAAFPDPVDPQGVLIGWRTTRNEMDFHRGLPPVSPSLVSTQPTDGSVGVSPQLYGDPDDLFPDRGPLRLVFDAPLFPGEDDLDRFQLVDLEDPLFAGGLPLGIDVRVVKNEVDRAEVEVQPSGILPFGHLLSLEVPDRVRGLSEDVPPAGGTRVAATLQVAAAPPSSLHDVLDEDFEDRERADPVNAQDLPFGMIPADWNAAGQGVLRAGLSFSGLGELGRFAPPPPPDPKQPRTVILDTSRQVFPLFDGSTPDAPPGFEVLGGQFDFTEIDIPDGVILMPRGPNPLVLTATGNVRIAGQIELSGADGTNDNSFDSAVAPMPGGSGVVGGGRGGDGHPVQYWPSSQVSNLTLVSPPWGGDGYSASNLSATGGGGGQSGIRDAPKNKVYQTNPEISCQELNNNDNNSRAAGGAGGAMLTPGLVGFSGKGNVTPDGQGGWILRKKKQSDPDWDLLLPGALATPPFSDASNTNDFIGTRGELQAVLGGQGGGGGGSRTEAYYCGAWCKTDVDPANDNVCRGGEFNGRWADSVGDARGGGGGGGGGGLLVRCLGDLTVESTAQIRAQGGRGGGGEVLGSSNWGGPAGGGSGGVVLLQASGQLLVQQGALINVFGGMGAIPGQGNGGDGLIQLQVPAGRRATVEDQDDILPITSWVDPQNLKNPAPFTPSSAGLSTWFDLGRVTQRSPSGTWPRFDLRGLDASGYVRTDATGNVLNPAGLDLVCDYLGQEDPLRPGQYLPGQSPRTNFIPPNASVRLEFQGGNPVAPGSKEVHLVLRSKWSASPSVADGMQFIRYRVIFDLTADGSMLRPGLPQPSVQSLRIRADF